MNLVYILHSTKLFYIGYTSDFDVRLDYHLNSNESRKFTHNASDWITFLKITNLKTGFTNRKANQEYEKQGLHPKPKEIS
jgi:predicted GIY-YIG superfamily endonuclease